MDPLFWILATVFFSLLSAPLTVTCISYTEVVASDAACLNLDAGSTTSFNAPINGLVAGVRFTYVNGSITCNTTCETDSSSYFTCCANDQSLQLQLVQTKISDGANVVPETVFPSNHTAGLASFTLTSSTPFSSCSNVTGCKYLEYTLSSLDPTDKSLLLLNFLDDEVSHLINVSTSSSFHLQSCGSFCGPNYLDRQGSVCYIVSFLYTSIIINQTDRFVTVYDPYNVRNWWQALSFCNSHFGTSLASINSSAELEHLFNSLYYTYEVEVDFQRTWIGLNDLNVTGLWQWSDGSDTNFTNWWNTQPDDVNEHCVLVQNHGSFLFMHDYNCDNYLSYQFVCNSHVITTPSQTSQTSETSEMPSYWPTFAPTLEPTDAPSTRPSFEPTAHPTLLPSATTSTSTSTSTTLITSGILSTLNDLDTFSTSNTLDATETTGTSTGSSSSGSGGPEQTFLNTILATSGDSVVPSAAPKLATTSQTPTTVPSNAPLEDEMIATTSFQPSVEPSKHSFTSPTSWSTSTTSAGVGDIIIGASSSPTVRVIYLTPSYTKEDNNDSLHLTIIGLLSGFAAIACFALFAVIFVCNRRVHSLQQRPRGEASVSQMNSNRMHGQDMNMNSANSANIASAAPSAPEGNRSESGIYGLSQDNNIGALEVRVSEAGRTSSPMRGSIRNESVMMQIVAGGESVVSENSKNVSLNVHMMQRARCSTNETNQTFGSARQAEDSHSMPLAASGDENDVLPSERSKSSDSSEAELMYEPGPESSTSARSRKRTPNTKRTKKRSSKKSNSKTSAADATPEVEIDDAGVDTKEGC